MAKDLMKWTNVSSLQNEINRMFDQFFRGWDFSGFVQEAGTWSPSIDLSETDDNIVVKAEIPGIDPKEVNISIQENNLILKGEKKEEKEEKGKNYYRMERRYGKFSRSIELPASVDIDKINAVCKNGIIEITLPKKEEVRPKQISVKVS